MPRRRKTAAELKATGSWRATGRNLEAIEAPSGEPIPTCNLTPEERAAWDQIVAGLRATGSLSPADSKLLTRWARLSALHDRVLNDVALNGYVVETRNGPALSPAARMLGTLEAKIGALELAMCATVNARTRAGKVAEAQAHGSTDAAADAFLAGPESWSAFQSKRGNGGPSR